MADYNAMLTVDPGNRLIALGSSSQHSEVTDTQVPSSFGDTGGIEEDNSMVINAAYLEHYEADADPDVFKRVRAKGVGVKSGIEIND